MVKAALLRLRMRCVLRKEAPAVLVRRSACSITPHQRPPLCFAQSKARNAMPKLAVWKPSKQPASVQRLAAASFSTSSLLKLASSKEVSSFSALRLRAASSEVVRGAEDKDNRREHDSRGRDVETEEEEEEVENSDRDLDNMTKGFVIIGGRRFDSRSDLTMYFSHLLHSTHLNQTIDESNKDDLLTMIKLGHPSPATKLGSQGVSSIMVGMHPVHTTNCFFLVRPDGSMEDFSYRKCVDGIVERFDIKFFSPLNSGSKIGTLALQKLINQGLQGEQEAWQIYNDMLDRGVANEYHSTVMLKTCGGDQQRSMLSSMRSAGITPTVATYNTLVSTLVLEGRLNEAEELLEEMQEEGVEPDNRIKEALRGFDLPMRRLKELTRHQQRRGAGEDQALQLFEYMLSNGVLETVHMNATMRLCQGSQEQRRMLERVQAKGVEPDLFTWTTIISQLMLEGLESEAEGVIEEMRAAGLGADAETAEEMLRGLQGRDSQEEEALAMLRDALLDIKKYDTQKAWNIFEDLLYDGEATEVLANMMIHACSSSKQLRRLTNRMLDAELVPSIDVYNAILSQLLFEGRTDQALSTLDEMEVLKIDSNALTVCLLDEIRRF